MKVVSILDFSDNLHCQNPEFASSLLNTFAPLSLAKVFSTEGSWYLGRITDLFKFVKSLHIIIAPDGFGTTTMPARHSVDSLTLLITPSFSILCSWSLLLAVKELEPDVELLQHVVLHLA